MQQGTASNEEQINDRAIEVIASEKKKAKGKGYKMCCREKRNRRAASAHLFLLASEKDNATNVVLCCHNL